MGRINGTNSDYKMGPNGIVEVDGESLYMKLYICPNGEDSALQHTSSYCDGTAGGCSNNNNHQGHAMIKLSEANGIELTTGHGISLKIGKDGAIQIGEHFSISASGEVNITGTLKINDTPINP